MAAYTAAGTQTFTKPRRIEGHTSNTVSPIMYSQYGTIAPANVNADGGFYIQHKIVNVSHMTMTPTNAAGATLLSGANAATDGGWVTLTSAIPWELVGAVALLGASTLTLGSGSSEIADVHNGAWIDIRFASGNIQTTYITDFAVTTNVATLADVLTEAVTTADSYRLRGSLFTTVSAATSPTFVCEVVGTFE
jgi:hypothetical protein